MTSGDWSGDADGLVFQNTGSRAVDVEYTTYTNDGTVPVDGTVCVTTSKASRQFFTRASEQGKPSEGLAGEQVAQPYHHDRHAA
ncbi:hypothetical protein [Streptomyces violaceusniger]|uniref:hypothetical protein n=1 Tax=Streptomyces violaceusniger TaxID=68280 RepID=UPI00368A723F